jgi:hypothetical protein
MNVNSNPALPLQCLTLALITFLGTAPMRATEKEISARGVQIHGLTWQREGDTVALLKDGKPVWQFNYSPRQTKTYFHPVALPGGSDLTWLSPKDHPHHLALFYCWKYLNHVNYWEEPAGVPDGATRWANVKVQSRPDFSANITMDLHYHPQRAAADVLTEKRRIRISPPARDGSYFMDWRLESTAGDEDVVMDRTPPDTEPDGNARGGYAGLSIRLAGEVTTPRVTATADIGTLASNRYGFAAAAAEFNGEIEGVEVGIAFFDHPSNVRFPTRWYAIVDKSVPFWFLNASWLQLQPFTLAAHQRLVLRYRVYIHPRRWDSARLEKEHARFVREAGKD